MSSTNFYEESREEHLFNIEDRRYEKNTKKILKSKDRSKYKKTNEKSKRRDKPCNTYKIGRVVEVFSENVSVMFKNDIYTCYVRGALKKEKTKAKNLITIGDFVNFDKNSIVKVLPRKSFLSRADNLSRNSEHIIAANVDQVFITLSIGFPMLNTNIADRYIIAAKLGNLIPILIVNKMDLIDFISKEERKKWEEFYEAYSQISTKLIPISIKNSFNVDVIKNIAKNKLSLFAGQSGTGKSSIINAITNANLVVGNVIKKTGKGSHTTTKSSLLTLDKDSYCIDTPGIRSFGMWQLPIEDISQYFEDIYEIGKQCKYKDCLHDNESGCAVIEAVNNHQLPQIRLNSYHMLLKSTKAKHQRR